MNEFCSDQKIGSVDPIFQRSWKWDLSKTNLHEPSIKVSLSTPNMGFCLFHAWMLLTNFITMIFNYFPRHYFSFGFHCYSEDESNKSILRKAIKVVKWSPIFQLKSTLLCALLCSLKIKIKSRSSSSLQYFAKRNLIEFHLRIEWQATNFVNKAMCFQSL